jgi:uncharacterized protein
MTLKYLLVLFVVAIGVWMVSTRSRKPGGRDDAARDKPSSAPAAKPQQMLRCAHCGLHLPASDVVTDGSLAYCSESHRRLGAGPAAGP